MLAKGVTYMQLRGRCQWPFVFLTSDMSPLLLFPRFRMVQAALLSRDAGVTAESEGEVFDTYTEDGTPLGRELRSVCHAKVGRAGP